MLVRQYHIVILPTNGKQPHKCIGKKIKQYWTNPPTNVELDAWFSDPTITSYAILCGAISENLSILDFDDKREYRRFRKEFSEIAKNTLTVRTPRGYHVYIRTQTKIRSQKIRGGDLQSEGKYAVGPSSIVNGKQYRIEVGKPILNITQNQVNNLLKAFGKKGDTKTPEMMNAIENQDTVQKRLETNYLQLAKRNGRNNALYQVAASANTMKIPRATTEAILINLHIEQKPQNDHKPESRVQRRREATATIRSAYNTSGTATLAPTAKSNKREGKIPTAVREALLKTTAVENKDGILVGGSTIPGRLLEALMMDGIEAGESFTYKKACEIAAKYKIGSKGVYETLRGELGNTLKKTRLFRVAKIPPNAGDTDSITNNENNPPNIVPFPSSRGVGRNTAFLFLMPSIDDICVAYDVTPQSWDELSPDDLTSAKRYRQAIHREFINRTAPEQSVLYMADRLGCHPRTIYRYDKSLGVQVVPIFGFVPLEWTNVDNSSFYGNERSDGITPGKWLQRSDGKRFPAVKGIALRQLSRGETLVVCERKPSKRLLSESTTILFDVIWRRSDLPIGQWDVGGSAYTLPEFGPEITPISVSDLPKAGTKSSSEQVSDDTDGNSLKNHASGIEKKRPIPHPVLDGLLTSITGIGNSRRDQLFDLGIFTLSDLVNADSDRLASNYWYGGYVTINNVLKWQQEAAILLGWEKPDPEEVEREKRKQMLKQAKTVYRRKLSSLIKFVDRAFTLIDGIAPIRDIECTATRIYIRLKQITSDSDGFIMYQASEVHQLALDFFAFFGGYINNFVSLADWQLEEYGFGRRSDWLKEARRLEKISLRFEVNEFDEI